MTKYDTALYKAYDAAGTIIYIGISKDWAKRWCQHSLNEPWYYDVVRLEVEWFSDRLRAQVRELALIREHEPRWNWAGTTRERLKRAAQATAGGVDAR